MKPSQYNQQTHKTRELISFPLFYTKTIQIFTRSKFWQRLTYSPPSPPFFTASSSVATILGTLTNKVVTTFGNTELLYCQMSTCGYAQGSAIKADNHSDSMYSADSVFATSHSYRIQKTKILKLDHRNVLFLPSLLFPFLQTYVMIN